MSSASLTSTEAVKRSNYHGSDRGGATTTNTVEAQKQTRARENRLTHVNRNHILKPVRAGTRGIDTEKKVEIILQLRKQKTSRSSCNCKW